MDILYNVADKKNKYYMPCTQEREKERDIEDSRLKEFSFCCHL